MRVGNPFKLLGGASMNNRTSYPVTECKNALETRTIAGLNRRVSNTEYDALVAVDLVAQAEIAGTLFLAIPIRKRVLVLR